MTEVSRRISEQLLEIGAVTFSPDKPFRWTSGILSPVYCDNRLTLAYPEVRKSITEALIDTFDAASRPPDAVIGVATGGIPHAAWLAERLGAPMGYVRSSAKQHGKRNQVEGFSKAGSRVVVVEDLVSTGMSSIAAVEAVRDAGVTVERVVAIFSYGLESSIEGFRKAGVHLDVLIRFEDLLDAAAKMGLLEDEARGQIRKWRTNPHTWSLPEDDDQ